MKINRAKHKILISLVALFTMFMCVSVGFATWITSGGDSEAVNGDIIADDYANITAGDAYCISDLSINSFRFYEKNGFVNEATGSYSLSTNITGSFTFEVSEAKMAIRSIRSSRQFSLRLDFTASVSTNFSVGTIAFGGFTSTVAKDVANTTTACAAYNITLTESEYLSTQLTNLSFTIPLSFSGQASSFPNLGSAIYTVSITPGEVLA